MHAQFSLIHHNMRYKKENTFLRLLDNFPLTIFNNCHHLSYMQLITLKDKLKSNVIPFSFSNAKKILSTMNSGVIALRQYKHATQLLKFARIKAPVFMVCKCNNAQLIIFLTQSCLLSGQIWIKNICALVLSHLPESKTPITKYFSIQIIKPRQIKVIDR